MSHFPPIHKTTPPFSQFILSLDQNSAMIQIRFAESDQEFQQIIQLQADNHKSSIDPSQHGSKGFVTLQHSFDELKTLHDLLPHVVAMKGDQVVGYALTHHPSKIGDYPLLAPLLDLLPYLAWNGKVLSKTNYLFMGQVCVAESERGQGIFRKLYDFFFEAYKGKFDFIITEISVKNTKSLEAHQAVGFEIAYEHEVDGDGWCVVVY